MSTMSPTRSWTPWRAVVMFGLVSLAADMVYEGARSLYGPLLAALGASAVVVGLVAGAAEATSLMMRLVFGPLADRWGAHWSLTIVGYGLTAVCVPLLAFAPTLGAAGLAVAVTLIILERLGKAIRSPSKTALLATVASQVGGGKGFGVHKALDQVGAFAGPLAVAAVAAVAGSIWFGLAAMAIPGAVAMILLFVLRRRAPEPETATAPTPVSGTRTGVGLKRWLAVAFSGDLPPVFFRFALSASLMTGGLVTFGLMGFHVVEAGLMSPAIVPVLYAGAMLTEALAALGVGLVFDRYGPAVLYLVPVLVAASAPLALTGSLAVVIVGVVVWGAAMGVQDSTIKALVADLVPQARRASAYGVFAGIQGGFAMIGGLALGWLYERSLVWLVCVVVVAQLAAMILLASTLRSRRAG